MGTPLIKCKKLTKLLKVCHEDFIGVVKSVLITKKDAKFNDYTLRFVGEHRGGGEFCGKVHVFEPDGFEFALVDARSSTDKYGSIILLEGKLVV